MLFLFLQKYFKIMNRILILGAGRSSSALIDYLLQNAQQHDWFVTVGDQSLEAAKEKVAGNARARGVYFDAAKADLCEYFISENDVVISMLPPDKHETIAKDCLRLKKHFLNASYLTSNITSLNKEVKENGLLFLCEMGLDPGIDHMSAMQKIHELRAKKTTIISLKSYCGGLIAPGSDTNPWYYKFTWNPRNVVLAGQRTAKFLQEGTYKYIPQNRIFTDIETITIKGYGKFEAYANRDSLSYIRPYGIEDVKTVFRATLRKEGYCHSWNALVLLGLTDDSYIIPNSKTLTYSNWVSSYLSSSHKSDIKKAVSDFLGLKPTDTIIKNLEWVGLFSDAKINLDAVSPAEILLNLLQQKWAMQPQDKDMVVMRHVFEYTENKKNHALTSTMILEGTDSHHTAMAKTVGLPLAIATKLLLTGKLKLKGVLIPVHKEIYEPVLAELHEHGILFSEEIS
jgi:saccharopine dehydrogenase-like NADP-dependent oxidoreductase